jgi:hypothetical protein
VLFDKVCFLVADYKKNLRESRPQQFVYQRGPKPILKEKGLAEPLLVISPTLIQFNPDL